MEVAAISGIAVRVVTTSQRYNDSDKMTSGRRKSRDTKLGLESRLTNKTDQLQMGLTVAYTSDQRWTRSTQSALLSYDVNSYFDQFVPQTISHRYELASR